MRVTPNYYNAESCDNEIVLEVSIKEHCKVDNG